MSMQSMAKWKNLFKKSFQKKKSPTHSHHIMLLNNVCYYLYWIFKCYTAGPIRHIIQKDFVLQFFSESDSLYRMSVRTKHNWVFLNRVCKTVVYTYIIYICVAIDIVISKVVLICREPAPTQIFKLFPANIWILKLSFC